MREPKANIVLLHGPCADSRVAEWQEQNKDREIKVGEFCKIGFKLPASKRHGGAEWMWVRVTDIQDDGKALSGILDNDPVWAQGVACGDTISFKFEDIADVLTSEGK